MINSVSKIIKKFDLTKEEAYQLANSMVNKEIDDDIIALALKSLAEKGETENEILGFVDAFKERMIKIEYNDGDFIDVCGMGGDKSNTFNVSTATALILAAYGVKVAKHGNRAVSSSSGSSDVLAELGVPIFNEKDKILSMLDKTNFVFLFAPYFHPAFKNVAEVRKKLAIKTIFNMLGPLLNPMQPKKQLIGTPAFVFLEKIFSAASQIDYEKIAVINEADQFDEVVLQDEVRAYIKNHLVDKLKFLPEYFIANPINLDKIKCNTPKESAEIILSVIKDRVKSEAYDVIVANSSLVLYLLEGKKSLVEYIGDIKETIDSGKVYENLIKIQNFK